MTTEDPRVVQMVDFLKTIAPRAVKKAVLFDEARSILMFAPLTQVLELPRTMAATDKQTQLELARLVELAEPLLKHLNSMHSTSLDAIIAAGKEMKIGGQIPFPDPATVVVNLTKVTRAANKAKEASAFPDTLPKKTTRPQKHAARQIALMTAWAFEKVAGKAPTIPKKDGVAYGDFHNLLRLTFDLVGMPRASAENMGREAIKVMEKSRVKMTR